MLSVQSASAIVLEKAADFGVESVPITEVIGRVLAKPLFADRDFPPFDRVTMDGIAIHYQSFAEGQREFPIVGMQAAGAPQFILQNHRHCLEVMTGAMLPQNTDTVIRYEDLEIKDGVAKVIEETIKIGQNIHIQGIDQKKGEMVVPANRLISPAEVGVAATIGKATLQVKKLPRVVIISTGDEIVEIEKMPLPHQIRSSNSYTIQSFLNKWKIQATRLHLPDERNSTIQGLQQALSDFDVVLLSGGVSEGKLDYVPDALATLGVQKLFHKVQQRPGKPFWFGKTLEGKIIFALPGNPVSAFICTLRYFEPWLRKSLGLDMLKNKFAVLNEDIHFKPNLTYFLQIRLESNEIGHLLAIPLEGGGSGDLANLTEADGFLELPAGKDVYEKGSVFPLWTYR
ncbi:MAG: molybdopterin molybdotransferase MoeA [Saprospiraceae bacterium]|nr:molybdopterin molybdotransferase MoeA [Saprospiraceae bacterium]